MVNFPNELATQWKTDDFWYSTECGCALLYVSMVYRWQCHKKMCLGYLEIGIRNFKKMFNK